MNLKTILLAALKINEHHPHLVQGIWELAT